MKLSTSRRKLGAGAVPGLVAAALAAVMAGCGDDPVVVDPLGTVNLVFRHEVDGQPLVLHTERYRNAAGNDYDVFELRYYLSNLELRTAGGATVGGPDVFYRDHAVPATERTAIANVPAGEYTSLRFRFGLDAAHNVLGGLPATPANLVMQWPAVLGGGYHFMQLDGRFTNDVPAEVGWMAHLGRLARSTDPVPLDPSFEVTLPVSVDVQKDVWTITVTMNVNEWFAPAAYDFLVIGENNMSNPAALQALHQNGADVFRIGATDHGP